MACGAPGGAPEPAGYWGSLEPPQPMGDSSTPPAGGLGGTPAPRRAGVRRGDARVARGHAACSQGGAALRQTVPQN